VRNTFFVLAALLALLAASALAADISGTWTASIDTQIGVQNYTYDLKVEGTKVTGTAKSQNGESKIQDGAIKGDEITFVENLDFQGQTLRIVYTGKIAGDEIKFNRKVADFASEDFVAKRSK
jgi:opacity protein-like surface antigen